MKTFLPARKSQLRVFYTTNLYIFTGEAGIYWMPHLPQTAILNISNDSISAPHAAAAGKNILGLKYTRRFQHVVSKIWTLCAIYLVPLPILYCHYSKPLPVSPYPTPPSLYLTVSGWLCQLPGRELKASRQKLFQLPDWWPPAFLLKLSFPLLSEESIFLLLLFQVNPSTQPSTSHPLLYNLSELLDSFSQDPTQQPLKRFKSCPSGRKKGREKEEREEIGRKAGSNSSSYCVVSYAQTGFSGWLSSCLQFFIFHNEHSVICLLPLPFHWRCVC